ncbi:DUF4232 domain-containing protein [Kitasatospora sp. NPDC058965]|uniref:DUF4232 domain-containing protein n=1 Tax=Kitasatospora sp. NPDC058965 TaxID=3346682 RepID=UPI003674818B
MTTSSRSRSFAILTLAAATACVLTACGSSSNGSHGAGPAAPAPSSAAPSAAPAPGPGSVPPAPGGSSGTAAAPSGGPTGAATAPATAPTPAPGAPGACATGQLSVKQQNADVAAGSYYAELVFTNTSATTCTLTGYPGVSYVTDNGVQSGNAADRAPGTAATVTLKPGGTASAQLHDANGVSGYDPAQCQLASAKGLRIYPPNQRDALFLPWPTQHCAGPTIHALTVAPVH